MFDYDLRNFISFAKANKSHPVIGIYNTKSKLQAKKYGVVRVDNNNRLIDFKEKPPNPKSTLVAMCLYYFPKGKLRLIKEYLDTKKNKQDATGFYIDWLRRKVAFFDKNSIICIAFLLLNFVISIWSGRRDLNP